jgi:hypothetical protein
MQGEIGVFLGHGTKNFGFIMGSRFFASKYLDMIEVSFRQALLGTHYHAQDVPPFVIRIGQSNGALPSQTCALQFKAIII